MDNYIGRRIEGRYEITELIGAGGMANVYKATDITDGKTVAVKILREEYYSNEEFLRRFKNESKAIAVLSHPNIIQVYDVCFSRKVQLIVMEYIDGITLKEYMEQQGALPWREAVGFVEQILRALSHAHDKGIVHRDIKPQNVMLLDDGSIKITDFGIARFARSEAKTLTDRAIGSVHYISPEQARGEHTDQRADIYSLGVILYEMLTGQVPFDADSPVSVALKQIQLEAPTPRSINPDIPEGVEDITGRAMQKDPALRYQSAADMLRDIETFKLDPQACFEYQYLRNEQVEEGRVRRAVRGARQGGGHAERPQQRKGGERVAKTSPRRPERDEHPQEERANHGSVMMILAGITAAFVVISGAFIFTMLYLNNPLAKVPDATVPELVGLRYDAVKIAPEYAKFVIEVQDSQYNELYERGTIIDQSPKADKTVKEGSTIRITLSNGQKIIEMPNLLGLEETVAYQKLAELDLQYTKADIFSAQPAGTVVATDPGPGSEVPAETPVKIQISMGPESTVVVVPDVKGLTLVEARRRLTEAGLEVGGISYVVSSLPAETVVEQDPAPSSQISKGGLVNLNVSGGEEKQNSVTLSVPLPADVTTIVKVQAVHNGQVLSEAQVQPSAALYWRPAFEGTGKVTINILYNDFLYQVIEIDFDSGTWVVTGDNTANRPAA